MISESHIRIGLLTRPSIEPAATKPSASARSRGGYMSVAATRNCCAALKPMPKISMPTISPTMPCSSIATPTTMVPTSARPSPSWIPGLRP